MTAPDLSQVMQARAYRRANFEWLVLPVLLAIGCALLNLMAATDSRWHDALDYRRHDIEAGQWWRLVTAHLMHVNATHMALDVAGLLSVAWIFARELDWKRQAIALLIGAAFVDAGLWFFHPEVARYVGLSGALHALFAAGAMGWLLAKPAAHEADEDAASEDSPPRHRRYAHRAWGAALLIGLAVKLVLENAGDAFWLHRASFEVVTAAHRWGSVGGALYGIALCLMTRRERRHARLRA